jgi:hypothetical protein
MTPAYSLNFYYTEPPVNAFQQHRVVGALIDLARFAQDASVGASLLTEVTRTTT